MLRHFRVGGYSPDPSWLIAITVLQLQGQERVKFELLCILLEPCSGRVASFPGNEASGRVKYSWPWSYFQLS